jgi:hypothetical protein
MSYVVYRDPAAAPLHGVARRVAGVTMRLPGRHRRVVHDNVVGAWGA